MYSLQKLVLNNKAIFKPGAFSIHQKPNTSVDHSISRSQEPKVTESVDVNQQSLIQLQAHMQMLQKRTPSKYKSEQNLKSNPNNPNHLKRNQELLQIIDNHKKSLSPQKRKEQTPRQKSNRKLNFNQAIDQEYLNSSNAMANMIIENILNKDEYYEKIRLENQELKDTLTRQQATINEHKRKQHSAEQQLKDLQGNLTTERQRYQNELLKINEKIQSMKTVQNNLSVEQKKNELLSRQLQDQISINNILKQFISENCIFCIDFLRYFQKTIQTFSQKTAFQATVELFKHSTSVILQTISKTQALNLPTLKNCILPEEFDVNGFFEALENLQKLTPEHESPELSFRQKSHSLSQVGCTKQNISSKNISLQDQFNTFLEQSDPIPEDSASQLGSPYFTNLDKPMRLQERFKMQMEKENRSMHAKMNQGSTIPQNALPQQQPPQPPLQQQSQFQQQPPQYFQPQVSSDKEKEKEKDKKRGQMPLQVSNFKPKSQSNPSATSSSTQRTIPNNNQLANFQSFNQINNLSLVQDQSDIDTLQYDSLIKELQNDKPKLTQNKDRSSSVHSLKYLDLQIQKEEEKFQKKNKENQPMNCQFVVAKYDYKAQKDVDLSFKKGDKIKLLKKTNTGWWHGEDEFGVKGYFPHNFVQLVD